MSCTNKKKGECAGKPKASAAKRSDRQGVPVSRVNYVQEMFKIPSIYKEIRHAQVARFETDIIASPLLNLSMLDADIQKAYEEMSGPQAVPTTGKRRRKLETEEEGSLKRSISRLHRRKEHLESSLKRSLSHLHRRKELLESSLKRRKLVD